MTDRELRKIRREELLEIMLKQEDELEQLREQLQEAEEKIKVRETELQKLSTIAEEALKLSGIFATAQAAANAYVEKAEREASALRRFICQRGKLRRVGQFVHISAVHRNKFRSLTVSKGDGASLIQHQNIHITGRLDGSAAHSKHIGLIQSRHTGNTDSGKQSADGSRGQTDQ